MLRSLTCFAFLLSTHSCVNSADLPSEVIASNLDNPCGIAVQPETGHIFVSLGGAGKIIRIVDGEVQDAIINFPKGVYGMGPKYEIGPLGLAFLDGKRLVVGGGGQSDGMDDVRIYQVPNLGDDPIDAATMLQSIGPLGKTENAEANGDFFGIAVLPNKNTILATSNGDDTKGWVARANVKEKQQYDQLEPFIATKEHVKTDAPVAIAISPAEEIVVGQMGEIDASTDSLLSFYDAEDGKLLLNLKTGLYDIVGLAYGPKKEKFNLSHLYALDFAWSNADQGGLFRLDAVLDEAGAQSIKSLRLAKLDKPTALAFGPDGSLYVTVFGSAADGAEDKPGKILKFAPGL